MVDQTQVARIVEMGLRDIRAGLGPLFRSYLRDLDQDTREAVAQAIKDRVYQIVKEL